MAKIVTPPQKSGPPKLLVGVNDAREKIVSRREQGVSLFNFQVKDVSDGGEKALIQASYAFKKWHDYNKELLRRMFDSEEYLSSYIRAGVEPDFFSSPEDLSMYFEQERDLYFSYFRDKLENLDSLAERLDLIDVHVAVRASVAAAATGGSVVKSNKIFVVHGHDSEAKSVVARFVEHCGLEPIVLHEQADQGQTIIEKFEQNADVSFAIILLTPDDVGCNSLELPKEGLDGLRPRARQNVILELGYFIGRLGRKNVCALKKGDMELPSDFSGVVYTNYDGADEGWKLKLVREIKAAGLDVDLNKALS